MEIALQSGLPESYFETIATAFEERLAVADVVDDILTEAVENPNTWTRAEERRVAAIRRVTTCA